MKPRKHIRDNQTCHKVLSRRRVLKYGIYGSLAAGLSPSFWLSGCTGNNKPKKMPNVILISLDTLRWDHVGCYGYPQNTTPNIDAFAEKSVLFEKCFVPHPNTSASHMSMLTGLYPATHGVVRTRALSKSNTTLTEVLKAEGYNTLGSVRACGQLNPQCGFGRGFDIYRTTPYHGGKQNMFIAKRLETRPDKKLFLFVHYYDIHSDYDKLPYDSPPPYNTMFYPDYKGSFTGGDGKLSASKYLAHVHKNKIKLNQDDRRYIAALYDGGVAYTDKCLGYLFGILKQCGLYDNSLIIVTSDHGEEFQEHDGMLHINPFYYDELVRVPMIIKLPGSSTKGKVIKELVESIDIMPSILAYLNVKKVPEMQGDNFMKLIDRDKSKWKDYVFGYSTDDVQGGPRAFVRNDRWKLLTSNVIEGKDFKMFDVSGDPQEMLDIAGDPDNITEQLKTMLLDKYKKMKKPGTLKKVLSTPEEIEKLKSLGYIQ